MNKNTHCYLHTHTQVHVYVVHRCSPLTDCVWCTWFLQAHVHGDAWSAEDEQSRHNQRHAGRVPGRRHDPGRVPELRQALGRATAHNS